MNQQEKVRFFYEYAAFSFRRRNQLKRFIIGLFKREGKLLASLNYVFVSDKYLLEINRAHLNHDYYTDIITFDLSSFSKTEAEIYISIDRVRDNAISHRQSFNQELHRVIFHGALHLCGYKDKTKKDVKVMRAKEEEYLKLYLRKVSNL